MAEITDAEQAAIVAENEQVLSVLVDAYRKFLAQDPGNEEQALGAVGMVLEGMGMYQMPQNMMMLIILAVRRLASGGGNG